MSTTHSTFFGKLIASIGDFLSHLITGAKNAFQALPPEQQDQLIKGVNVSQLIKDGYTKGETYIVTTISTALAIPPEATKPLIIAALTDMGFKCTVIQDGLNQLADKIQEGVTDNNWNGLWQLAASGVATYLSGGTVNWLTMAFGALEFAYQEYVASKK